MALPGQGLARLESHVFHVNIVNPLKPFSLPQHKPRLQRIQQLKRINKRHPKVLANVGDQEFTAGSQVQLLMCHHRGVEPEPHPKRSFFDSC
jgi:hypothetical protein